MQDQGCRHKNRSRSGNASTALRGSRSRVALGSDSAWDCIFVAPSLSSIKDRWASRVRQGRDRRFGSACRWQRSNQPRRASGGGCSHVVMWAAGNLRGIPLGISDAAWIGTTHVEQSSSCDQPLLYSAKHALSSSVDLSATGSASPVAPHTSNL